MKENWTRWEPILGLSESHYIDSVSNDENGFMIILLDANNKSKKLFIKFENSVDCYRSTNESYTGSLVRDLRIKYGKDFYVNWTFFKVTDSEYLQWLSEKSGGLSDTRKLIHFAIFSLDELLEVVCPYEPTVRLVNT